MILCFSFVENIFLVFIVRDGTERQVAIKKISDVLHDLVDAKRLLREIQIGRHLAQQENIISTVDVMVTRRSPDDEDDLYIVTDLFPTDLHRVVHSKNVPLGGDHVKFFLWQLSLLYFLSRPFPTPPM